MAPDCKLVAQSKRGHHEMSAAIDSAHLPDVTLLDSATRRLWEEWTGRAGPPVPVKVDKAVWETLLLAVKTAVNPVHNPQVFRLFMKRRTPRHVVSASKIEKVWRTKRGIIRWEERGYPSLSESLRKGGNAFIRGDTHFRLDDAWWMGREQTELRILLAAETGEVEVTAWWARGGTGSASNAGESDGELWRVKLLISG